MNLHTQLKVGKSEEDVKDAYIKTLGLKGYTKGLIDIQTQKIWFEVKDTAPIDIRQPHHKRAQGHP